MLLKPRNARTPAPTDDYAGIVAVHATACYDLLVSLRALFNPRTYETTRAWATVSRGKLSEAGEARGRFFFRGHETSLGYGVTRLVATLPQRAQPSQLIDAVRAADPVELALMMLDTGETPADALNTFRSALTGRATGRAVDAALTDLPAGWARVNRQVLADPAAAQTELTLLLDEYLDAIFADEIPHVVDAIERGAKRAHDLLGLVSTPVAIEQLTGGYTIAPNLALARITLAPSAFIHPYVAARLDERLGEALVVFGVRSDTLDRFDSAPIDADLLKATKALGDPARLRLLKLLSRGPLNASELQSLIGLSPPTVHHHLHQLRAAGLVRQERTKGGMRYAIRRESAADILAALMRLMLEPD